MKKEPLMNCLKQGAQIYLQLICEYKGKSKLPSDEFFFNKAYSIFESKRHILLKMEELDPGRGWLVDGARFIKTPNGKAFAVERLDTVFESLESEGHDSLFFTQFSLFKSRS
jgi:hypothetical protein